MFHLKYSLIHRRAAKRAEESYFMFAAEGAANIEAMLPQVEGKNSNITD